MTLHIRPIQPQDNGQLAAIIRHNLEQVGLDIPGTAYFDPELDHLSDYYATQTQPAAYFVLVDDQDQEQVKGGVGVAAFSKGVAELQKLYLADEVKGQGYSYQLMQAVLDFARQHYTNLYLETHSSLEAAVHLYEKLGFQRLPGQLPGGVHSTMDIFMEKVL
jgi:putative acetyltransferase